MFIPDPTASRRLFIFPGCGCAYFHRPADFYKLERQLAREIKAVRELADESSSVSELIRTAIRDRGGFSWMRCEACAGQPLEIEALRTGITARLGGTVARGGKRGVITVYNVQPRQPGGHRRDLEFECCDPDREVYHCEIVRNKSIRLYGHRVDWNDKVTEFDRTFRIGDVINFDSWNLTYTSPIIAIGPKTVTVEGHNYSSDGAGQKSRMDLHRFAYRNWNLDLEAIEERNRVVSRDM